MRGFTPPPQTLNDAPCPPFTSHGASLAMLRAVRWQYNPVTPEHQVFCDALACIKANILFKPVDRTDFMAGYEQVSRRAQLTKTLARSTDNTRPARPWPLSGGDATLGRADFLDLASAP
jgi:hypothetical protein